MPQLFCINALASPSPQTLNLTFPAFPLDTKKDAANERLFNQNGGVVNPNGIEHTKSKTLQSQITGNLQGISLRFSPPYHHVYLELLSLHQNPSPNYQGI